MTGRHQYDWPPWWTEVLGYLSERTGGINRRGQFRAKVEISSDKVLRHTQELFIPLVLAQSMSSEVNGRVLEFFPEDFFQGSSTESLAGGWMNAPVCSFYISCTFLQCWDVLSAITIPLGGFYFPQDFAGQRGWNNSHWNRETCNGN